MKQEYVSARQYAEQLIAEKEARQDIFNEEQRDLILQFAHKLDDMHGTKELVEDLSAAIRIKDEMAVSDFMYGAEEKINALPDSSIGLSELHEYGYRGEDMLPLTQARALEFHQLGEKVYPLFRDGTVGDYASREEILQHEGIFGIQAAAWEWMREQEQENYMDEDYPYLYPPMTVLNKEEALRLYDAGERIYLVTVSRTPIAVRERAEIERGSDTFQIAIEDLERVHDKENRRLQEDELLYGSEKRFGIYQITARDPEHDYRFMNLAFVKRHGMEVNRADYELIYTAPLTEADTLDKIYERFNIQRPDDFTGHSLSVSDVVVFNEGSAVKAFYVDSIDFQELPDFFKERSKEVKKETIMEEPFDRIELFGKPGLYSDGRLADSEVPEGLYRYDLRGSDFDPGQPVTVEKKVVVNHAASVLMAEEIDLGKDGWLHLGEEGLNFLGDALTVREFMDEQEQKKNALIHGDSYHIPVEGHIGTWYAVDETEIGGEKFFLLEHEEYGDMAACVAVNERGKLVAEDLWNGFDEAFQDAVKEYFAEKNPMPQKDEMASESVEQAAPVETENCQTASDIPVYYGSFSYAKERDEVDLYRTSYRVNGECKRAIEEAISANFDGMYLKDGTATPVVQQYGWERVSYILANTLHEKQYDGRFSHRNKDWAKEVCTQEHDADYVSFKIDWLVNSHPAVLDGFVTMFRDELKLAQEVKQEKPFVNNFYVVEDLMAAPLKVERFGNLDDAMSHYQALPNIQMKALGVEKTPDPLPGSLDIVQCKNGIDTVVEDYKKVPGWDNPYIQNHVVALVEGALKVQDVEVAYEMKDAYFHIQTCDEGYDYTLYNKDFSTVDGGILETDGQKPVQDVINEVLSECGHSFAECRVVDAGYLREQAYQVEMQKAESMKEKLAAEKLEPTISFYVAECSELPVNGEFHRCSTIAEAMTIYEITPTGRMDGTKGIGISVSGSSEAAGMYDLMVGGKIQIKSIEAIPALYENPQIQQVISEMKAILADHQEQVKENATRVKKTRQKGARASESVSKEDRAESSVRESVRKALRERQAQKKAEERTQPKQKTQKKKGEVEL